MTVEFGGVKTICARVAVIGMIETTAYAMRVGGWLLAALAICADALVLFMPAAVAGLWPGAQLNLGHDARQDATAHGHEHQHVDIDRRQRRGRYREQSRQSANRQRYRVEPRHAPVGTLVSAVVHG